MIGEGALMHFTTSDLTNCNVEKSESEKYIHIKESDIGESESE